MGRTVHFWCYIAVLILAPLPLGSNRPAFWTLLAILTGLLCLAWPLAASRDPARVSEPFGRLAAPLLLVSAVCGWALIQAVPGLPEVWTHPLWTAVRPELADVSPRVAIDADAARDGAMRLLLYAGIAYLALQHGRSSRRAHRICDAIALSGGAYALYGLWSHFSGAQTILGMAKWAYEDSLTSTFVNRNSYAAFAGLGLLCAFSACWRRLEATTPTDPRILLHLRRPTMLYVAAALLICAALPATASRAGTAASLVAVVILVLAGWCAIRARRRLVPWLALGAVPLLAGGALVWILAWSETGASMASDRLLVYGMTLDFVSQRPWLGHGLGSFPALFRMHRPLEAAQVWTEAHNSYLELASDLGLPAAIALIAAVLWLTVICVLALIRGSSERETTALAVAATALIAIHALVDFSAQIPAVTVTWMAILGCGVARAWRALDARSTAPPERTSRLRRRRPTEGVA